MFVRTVSLLALSCALAAPALANDAAAEAAEDAQTGSIVVTGTRETYATEETSTATRTPTDLNDVPQAISIVTERQIEDQAMLSIGDVLRSIPGATIGQGEGHRDQITIRGNTARCAGRRSRCTYGGGRCRRPTEASCGIGCVPTARRCCCATPGSGRCETSVRDTPFRSAARWVAGRRWTTPRTTLRFVGSCARSGPSSGPTRNGRIPDTPRLSAIPGWNRSCVGSRRKPATALVGCCTQIRRR